MPSLKRLGSSLAATLDRVAWRLAGDALRGAVVVTDSGQPAGGFGAFLARRLAASGSDVVAIAERPDEAVLDGIEVVYHAAPLGDLGHDLSHTERLLAAAADAGVRKLVCVTPGAIRDADPDRLERMVLDAARTGPDVTVLRAGPVAGVGPAWRRLLRRLHRGRRLYLAADLTSVALTDADDLACACRLAARHSVADVLTIACADGVALDAALRGLVAHAGTGSRLVAVPALAGAVARRIVPPRLAAPWARWQSFAADVRPAHERLGWRPRHGTEEALCAAYDRWKVQGS